MKKTRASVSPSLFLRGRTPVVTAYLRTPPARRSSWRVVTGFSSSRSFAFSASVAGEGDGDGLGVGACRRRRDVRNEIMNAPFSTAAGTLSSAGPRRQGRPLYSFRDAPHEDRGHDRPPVARRGAARAAHRRPRRPAPPELLARRPLEPPRGDRVRPPDRRAEE